MACENRSLNGDLQENKTRRENYQKGHYPARSLQLTNGILNWSHGVVHKMVMAAFVSNIFMVQRSLLGRALNTCREPVCFGTMTA